MSKLDQEFSNGIGVYAITLKNDIAMTNQRMLEQNENPLDSTY